jgi:cytochrome c oxidase subunit II
MSHRFAIVPIALLLPGCAGIQTALGGDGGESANFVRLFALFIAICAFMYLLVVAGLLAGIWRQRKPGDVLTVETGRHHESSGLLKRLLTGWVVLVTVGLAVLTLASFVTDRSNAALTQRSQMSVKVTGNQWWWDIEYRFPNVSKSVRTANELHLPVDVPIELKLESNDVIHSFWIPNLAGKQDLIPGRVTDIQLLPRRTGLYRGQCAEFCGIQHAKMALDVTVESRADFGRWIAAQQRPALAPRTPQELAGYRYITTRECSVCHSITGSPANARVGPNLTHFASRRSIAAGALPMNKGNLYGWVADPQSQKPGSNMPTIGLSAEELHSVVAYLERLK